MLDREKFFKKFSITDEAFKKTGLEWETLEEIYRDYTKLVPLLEKKTTEFTLKLIDSNAVHSVRRRVKKPIHLIEKIIRKGEKYSQRNISVKNYKKIVTDLIGVRVLHLFKDDWMEVHNEIISNWEIAETPQINIRRGDYNMEDLKKSIEHLNCDIIIREHGYRSVHYLVESSLEETGEIIYTEMQVRTVFEEAWSEIDHLMRYPYDVDNPIISEYLSIFNRIVGSADEMGMFMKSLKPIVSKDAERQKLLEEDHKYK